MTSGVFSGDEWEVRIATTTALVTTATAIPYVSSVTYKVDEGIKQVAMGLGDRRKVAHATLQEISGTLKRNYDETVVQSTNEFITAVSALSTSAVTELVLEIKNKTSSWKFWFTGVVGSFSFESTEDGFATETWDWGASAIVKTS